MSTSNPTDLQRTDDTTDDRDTGSPQARLAEAEKQIELAADDAGPIIADYLRGPKVRGRVAMVREQLEAGGDW